VSCGGSLAVAAILPSRNYEQEHSEACDIGEDWMAERFRRFALEAKVTGPRERIRTDDAGARG
jgi:hypothetical protein